MLELRSGALRAQFLPLGARLVSLWAPDAGGGIADVVSGPGNETDILAGDGYAGAVTGRFANRISAARFPLDGKNVQLTANLGPDHLHGGTSNCSNTVWQHEMSGEAIRFGKHFADGDEGYPGDLEVSATYRLADNFLSLDLQATTTRPTVINLTNHAYWNLAGSDNGLDQELEIDADHVLALRDAKLPTGRLDKVDGTRFDFRRMRRIGAPYDHAFCLNGKRGTLKRAAILRDPRSGRSMEIHTTECSVQLYTADHFNPSLPGKYGPLRQYCSVALEPQNYPDAPNHANFPSAILRPGEVYRHRIEWRFG